MHCSAKCHKKTEIFWSPGVLGMVDCCIIASIFVFYPCGVYVVVYTTVVQYYVVQ
jgi:hypothetical protein